MRIQLKILLDQVEAAAEDFDECIQLQLDSSTEVFCIGNCHFCVRFILTDERTLSDLF